MDELVDVLDEFGKRTGSQVMKSEAHEKRLWHATVHVWIINSKNELLIQKRASVKDDNPDKWDVSMAGHVSAGEEPEVAAIRELEEELGIKVGVEQLVALAVVKSAGKDGCVNKFASVFLLSADFSLASLKLQESEVDEVKLISLERFVNEVVEGAETYVPHPLHYYQEVFKKLSELYPNMFR